MTTWRLTDADWNTWLDGTTDAQLWQQGAGLGLAGIELGVYDAAVELAPDRLAELARLAKDHDLPVAGILLSLPAERWPGGALSGDIERLLDQVRACARVCETLGLDVLGLWPGADPVGAEITVNLRRVVAAAHPIRIAVEYKPGTVVGSADEAVALCWAVPGAGVLLDTGHAFAAREDPAQVVRQLGDLLLHCHLGDAAPGGSDDDLPCGRLHDLTTFTQALAATGYAGAASFDLYGVVASGAMTGADAVRESRDHLMSRPA